MRWEGAPEISYKKWVKRGEMLNEELDITPEREITIRSDEELEDRSMTID